MSGKKVLVAYATNSGSTGEVAQTIGETLAKAGCAVDVRSLPEVTGLEGYSAVVIGAPMILGWHRAARTFLKKNQAALSRLPVAYFFTALNLTQTPETTIDGISISLDPLTAKPPRNPAKLSFHEKYSTMGNYLRPVLKAAPMIKPVSVAFFGGKLEMFKLKLLPMLFVMLVIRAAPGDSRNWEFIKQWAQDVARKIAPR